MGIGAAFGIAASVASVALSAYQAFSAKAPTLNIPTPPVATPTPPAPVMNQQAVNQATQTQTALAAASSGRQSTILNQTPQSDKLG